MQYPTELMHLFLPFDSDDSGGTNTTKDYSGYANVATLGNISEADPAEPTWNSSGKIGGAYEFDCSDDFINVSSSNSVNVANNITVSMWVRFRHVNKDTDGYDWEALFTKSQYGSWYGLMLCTDASCQGTLRFYHEGLTPATSDYAWSSVAANQWYHVVANYNVV